jgi:signal-transduction protein with cAMP-binding, CBS, and nucleotidyltransferase domain
MVPVKEFVTPNLLTVKRETTMLEAASLMASVNIGSLVVQCGDAPCGIITERDIIRNIAQRKDLSETLVGDAMTANLVTIPSSMAVKDALVVMSKEAIRHLLVEEGGRIIGMFSFKNFLDLERLRIGFI